jgi:hypothetical protein
MICCIEEFVQEMTKAISKLSPEEKQAFREAWISQIDKLQAVATKAVKCGIATTRFSITREQAAELKRIEAEAGQEAGLRYILKLLADQMRKGVAN